MNRKKLNVLIGFAICFCTCVSVFLLTRILPYGAQNNFADSPDGNLTAVEWVQYKQPGTSLTPPCFLYSARFYAVLRPGSSSICYTESIKAEQIQKN